MPDLSRRNLIKTCALASSLPVPSDAQEDRKVSPEQTDRHYWVSVLNRLSHPVLAALSERKLKVTMPVEAPHNNGADRSQYTYLEAFGRLLAGIAPWLESADDVGLEADLRRRSRFGTSIAVLCRRPVLARFYELQQRPTTCCRFGLSGPRDLACPDRALGQAGQQYEKEPRRGSALKQSDSTGLQQLAAFQRDY
jgi:Uncharacterized protein conserved in bacteria (DUF2264)